jgi:SAM-dependent methyltransferase
LAIYDTQRAFRFEACAYPIPDLLRQCDWIDLTVSAFKPDQPPGCKLSDGVVNQNLERLTFPDASFDIVITSDVMEHVRLDEAAHREIARVLVPGGDYVFTVPHFTDRDETVTRVEVHDPADPSRDVHVLAPEYHGDANATGGVLVYRSYGRGLQRELSRFGLRVEYAMEDLPETGILHTELFVGRRQ